METLSALLSLCEGNLPVTGEFPSQRPLRRSFDVFFDLSLSKRLSKPSRRRWFETPSRSLWRPSNGLLHIRNLMKLALDDCHWGMKHGLQVAGVTPCVIGQSKYRFGDTWNNTGSDVTNTAYWCMASKWKAPRNLFLNDWYLFMRPSRHGYALNDFTSIWGIIKDS